MKFDFLKEEDDKIMDFMIGELLDRDKREELTEYHQGILDVLLVLNNAEENPKEAWGLVQTMLMVKDKRF